MRVLFDQGTPVGILDFLRSHTVATAYELGWSTLTNGELLRAAEEAGFDVLLTTDKNLIHQQNLTGRQIAIVVLGQARWKAIKPMQAVIAKSIEQAKPGTYTIIEVPG
jgi:aminoglycoside phosphotransferase (APT) family kinase protein